MNRWLFLTFAAIPVLFTTLRPGQPSLTWWTTDAMQKIRPFDSPPSKAGNPVEITAARNEFESFQIVFRTASQDLDGMDLEVSDFEGANHAVLSRNNIALYF